MPKDVINKLIEQFKIWKQDKEKYLPSFLVYSKSFLSFTKDKDRIVLSQNDDLDKSYNVFFILKKDEKIINKYTCNADIEDISTFEKEKEVLFSPFTTFIMEDIHEGNINGNECIIINLEYLGCYEHLLNKFRQENDFKNKIKESFVKYFQNQNYIKKLIKNNLLGNYKNVDSDENDERKNKVILSKIKRKIKEKFDIDINEEIEGEKKDINNIVFEIDENIKVYYKDKKLKI